MIPHSHVNEWAIQHQQWSHYTKRQSTKEDSLLCVSTDGHAQQDRVFSLLCLGFFFLLHFSILDNTLRIDIKQK